MAEVVVGPEEVSSGWIDMQAGVVAVVKFAANVYGIEVRSRGEAAVYFTVDGSVPTIDGRNCYDLMAGVIAVDERNTSDADTVKLISDGPAKVRVVRT